MLKFVLETERGDIIDLNAQQQSGWGWQAHAGVIGMGLPPVQGQWLEGAGDGAVWRGQRVLSRDIDIPMSYVSAPHYDDVLARDKLIEQVGRMGLALSGECKLTAQDTNGQSWYIMVRRAGGGNYVYGRDTTGERDIEMVITFRAGDPYWTAVVPKVSEVITQQVRRGLTASPLTNLRLASSTAAGTIRLDNSGGDADAYPVWFVHGPGHTFKAVSPAGPGGAAQFQWNGTLTATQSLTIDTRTGTVIDQAGVNRYDEMAPAPNFWPIPVGIETVTASIQAPGPETRIAAQWRPRKWAIL